MKTGYEVIPAVKDAICSFLTFNLVALVMKPMKHSGRFRKNVSRSACRQKRFNREQYLDMPTFRRRGRKIELKQFN